MIVEEGNYVWLLAANAHNVDGWRQVAELGLALLLSALVGLEREIRQKSAGLRTYTPGRGRSSAIHAERLTEVYLG
jgi:hypothetical protein